MSADVTLCLVQLGDPQNIQFAVEIIIMTLSVTEAEIFPLPVETSAMFVSGIGRCRPMSLFALLSWATPKHTVCLSVHTSICRLL
jgi:hypothetical protein